MRTAADSTQAACLPAETWVCVTQAHHLEQHHTQYRRRRGVACSLLLLQPEAAAGDKLCAKLQVALEGTFYLVAASYPATKTLTLTATFFKASHAALRLLCSSVWA